MSATLRPHWFVMATVLVAHVIALPAISQVAASGELVVSVEPANNPPTEVLLIPAGGIPAPLSLDAPAGGYRRDVSITSSEAWDAKYTIVARWAGINEQLYLRITRNTPENISVRIFNKRPTADSNTLDLIEQMGPDLMSQLEKYFVARDVYRALTNPKLKVKQRALKDWYDAAFVLAKDYSYIAPDQEVIDIVKNTDLAYFTKMNEQFLGLEWADVSLVQSYIQGGNPELAKVVNKHYEAKFSGLSVADRAAVARAQGVNAELLKKNADFLANFAKAM